MANTQAHTGTDLPFSGSGLVRSLADNWWLVLLRGIAAVAFGILAFLWPGLTLLTLVLLWGAYALSDGILALWAAIAAKGGDAGARWWLALVGVVGVLAGLFAFFWPGPTALALLIMIASWAIVIGALQIWGAIELRKEIEGEWLLALNGVLSIAFGVLMLIWPGAGALATVWMIGWFALLIGFCYIGLAFRLKGLRK